MFNRLFAPLVRHWPWAAAGLVVLLVVGYSIPGYWPKTSAALRLGERREDLKKYEAAHLTEKVLVVIYRADVASSVNWVERDVTHSMEISLDSIKWFDLDDRRGSDETQWPRFSDYVKPSPAAKDVPIQSFVGVGSDGNGAGPSLRQAAASSEATLFRRVRNDLVIVVGAGCGGNRGRGGEQAPVAVDVQALSRPERWRDCNSAYKPRRPRVMCAGKT